MLQNFIVGALISGLSSKRVRLVGLRPGKDLAYMNQLLQAGQLAPIIDSQYALAEVADVDRCFGAADQTGKIVVTI